MHVALPGHLDVEMATDNRPPTKGPYLYDVRKIIGFLNLLPLAMYKTTQPFFRVFALRGPPKLVRTSHKFDPQRTTEETIMMTVTDADGGGRRQVRPEVNPPPNGNGGERKAERRGLQRIERGTEIGMVLDM